MPDPEAAFTYDITRRDDIVVCTLSGHLDAPASERMFDDVERALEARNGSQVLLFDATGLESFEAQVIPVSRRYIVRFDRNTRAVAVITERASIRFGLSLVQLATKRQ